MSIVDDSMRFRANVWSSVNSNCGSLASFRTSVSVEFGSRERHEASLVYQDSAAFSHMRHLLQPVASGILRSHLKECVMIIVMSSHPFEDRRKI